MAIKCYNCGKTYDYLKTDGICPKCYSYNSETQSVEEQPYPQEQTPQQVTKQPKKQATDKNQSYVEMLENKVRENQIINEAQQSNAKRRTTQFFIASMCIFTGFLILVIITLIANYLFGTTLQDINKAENVEIVNVEKMNSEQAIQNGIFVTDAFFLDDVENREWCESYRALVVNIKPECALENNVLNKGKNYDQEHEFYIKTQDNICISNITDYDEGYDDIDKSKLKDTNVFKYEYGGEDDLEISIIFLVPKTGGDNYSLSYVIKEYNSDYKEHFVDKITTVPLEIKSDMKEVD